MTGRLVLADGMSGMTAAAPADYLEAVGPRA